MANDEAYSCVPDATLRELARLGEPPDAVKVHLERCEACREAYEHFRTASDARPSASPERDLSSSTRELVISSDDVEEHHEAAFFLFDSTGGLQELDLVEDGGNPRSRWLTYPKADSHDSLDANPGTAVFILCARQEGPRLEEIAECFLEKGPWPSPSADTALIFTQGRWEILKSSGGIVEDIRGVDGTIDQIRNPTYVLADGLRRCLAERFTLFHVSVVPHR